MSPAKVCTARRQDGEPCRAPAIKGGSVCRVHGGRAPQVRAAAARRLAEGSVLARLEAAGELVADEPPVETLARLIRVTRSYMLILEAEMAEVVALYGPVEELVSAGDGSRPATVSLKAEQHVVLDMWGTERDRLAKYVKMASDIGMDERRVQLAEGQARLLADQVLALVRSLELDPNTPKVRSALRAWVLGLERAAGATVIDTTGRPK